MRLFVRIAGRWIHPDHVTHIGAIDLGTDDASDRIPPGTRSYVALTGNKFLYLPLEPTLVVALLEGRDDRDAGEAADATD